MSIFEHLHWRGRNNVVRVPRIAEVTFIPEQAVVPTPQAAEQPQVPVVKEHFEPLSLWLPLEDSFWAKPPVEATEVATEEPTIG